jgi:hypothetical protein
MIPDSFNAAIHLSQGLEKAMLSAGLTRATYNSKEPVFFCLAKIVLSRFRAQISACVEKEELGVLGLGVLQPQTMTLPPFSITAPCRKTLNWLSFAVRIVMSCIDGLHIWLQKMGSNHRLPD